ncbi:Carboxypeptidase regulatory-like domain-containing protein [Dyella sp. OK004]|uniref:TonB-dependent receptor n=1 Tax=Dyella sp. OK004 TaxID=1855292 RepID=UPI0008E280C7|nr:TonB-dependent receptor plug domain-containing protein [Dyella sp. OK004]SFR95327.1 Carboxypeptidase regulatory-like domain-containing protein [Dyella sp. OK004]
MKLSSLNRSLVLRRSTLAAALTVGLAGVAFAQSTTGTIFGQAEAGETITASGSTGISRSATVDASGRYRISNLPLGTYAVTLQKNGATVDTRNNVAITVNAGTEVSFASATSASSLSAVTVTANALPTIDVSSVDSRTVITSQALERLPLGRSAEAIALLAPGVVQGSGYFQGQSAGSSTVSFGGSGVTENAYYINGYNSSDPLKNLGGIGLPYGAIDQQEIYTGGYSAMYGRSDGGVISQVGKRGTNDWHFGGQVVWAPRFLAEDPDSYNYPNAQLPNKYGYTTPALAGTPYRTRKNNTSWDRIVSAYAGGPLVKDHLYMFAAAEAEKREGKSTSSAAVGQPNNSYYTYDIPKYYVKLDWNINDSNIVELTGISNKTSYEGTLYKYDYATQTEGAQFGHDTSTKTGSDIWVGKYTGYLTENLTVMATYGQNRAIDYSTVPGSDPTLPFLSGVTAQDPLITHGTPIRNGVTVRDVKNPGAHNKTHGLRLDVEYKLGDHTLTAGIDNMHYAAYNEGVQPNGPGYAWYYSKSSSPATPINPALGVGAPGGRGYYARRYILVTSTSMSVDQKAQYIEDRWQINDKVLLSVGLRDDQFTNYNSAGKSYVDNKNQWAPRLGFSWDVLGDSTFKVFGNLGRYYLALPNSVAIRGASASLFTSEYFTYTGIDAKGNPTGLKAIGPGPVSANGEYGQAPDPKTFAASNLKSQYQDEAILGFSKMLGPNWVVGAKGTLRVLQTAIDDVCDPGSMQAKIVASGIDPKSVVAPTGCRIFNPGETNTFLLKNTNGNGYTNLTMTTKDWGFTQGAKRKYYALDLFVEHPFDGTWQGRVDYTWSRSYGNTEGQVLSTIGQDDVSKTQDWDTAALMANSNGVLSNDRTHQLKAYGAYQISPEWLVSGALRVMSGAPKACLGYFGTNEADPSGYGSRYRWCAGQTTAMGSNGRLPWQEIVDVGVTYRPAFADKKLAFTFNIFNLLNQRRATTTDATYETGRYTVSNSYGVPLYQTTPRYGRFAVTYDF